MDTLNLLLVDDEKDFLATLAEKLINRGINVLSATDGSEALQIIKRMSIDVVVLDIVMPGRGGVETLKEIKKQYPDLDVVVGNVYGSP